MATTRAPVAGEPFVGVEQKNPAAYARARALGMRHDAAVLAVEHPEYLAYFRRVHPMDFKVAFSHKDGINAVLTRLGYDVSDIEEPERAEKPSEDIRPKAPNW